ncbi:MAG: hypothetical protein ACR2QM_06905, partial [Longimicrobiales bacterium]
MDYEKSFVIEELNRICASSEFSSKPAMQKLLSYLVTEYVEGRSDQIKGYSIGIDVFAQEEAFDPDRSALVRNSALRLRRLLKTYYLEEGRRDPLRIEIPKGTYVPSLSRINGTGTSAATSGAARRPRVAVSPLRILRG